MPRHLPGELIHHSTRLDHRDEKVRIDESLGGMAPARERLGALGLAAPDLDRGLEERFELVSLQALVDLPGAQQGSDLGAPWRAACGRVRPEHIPKLLSRKGLRV